MQSFEDKMETFIQSHPNCSSFPRGFIEKGKDKIKEIDNLKNRRVYKKSPVNCWEPCSSEP